MKNSIPTSVIIRTRNEERWIGHSIQSIIDNISEPEIIVIDNNSSDETLSIVKSFAKNPNLDLTDKMRYTNINIFNIDDYTPGKSLNLGIKKSNNQNCIIISAHCVISKINLDKHFGDLKKYVSIFGNQIPIWNGKKITKRYIWSHFINKKIVNMYSELENRYFFHNAISIFEKSFLESHPFDEFLQSKEDRYWANDMIQNHNKKILYDPDIEVYHHYTKNGNTWKGLG